MAAYGVITCVLVIVSGVFRSVARADETIVDTQYGRLRGLEMRSKDSPVSVMAYLGIPYAQPPVGDLRLALPRPVSPWEGVRDATQHGPACPQDDVPLRGFLNILLLPDRGQSEDCLHLDVYTPGLDGHRPVLVVIHGGGFLVGWSTLLINGTALTAHEDIVVVSIQYRLGALGNLYNTEGAWPSNLGLRDQQFALHWVKNNIAAFGGDPDRVTLNGESAGGMSVSAQILAPSSRGLFHRAFVQSGSIFSVFSTREPQERADTFTAHIGCASGLPIDNLHCLRQKSVEETLAAQVATIEVALWEQVWDGDFLPVDPIKAYSEGSFSRVDYMSGPTSNEGDLLLAFLTPELYSSDLDLEKVQTCLARELERTFGLTENVQEMLDDLLGNDAATHDDDRLRQRTSDILGEYLLQAPTYLAAKLHSAHVSNSYWYECTPQPSFLAPYRPAWNRGCDHAMDMVFMFGFPQLENVLADGVPPMQEDESDFSKVVMKYIANFVKTGDPNGDGLPQWKPLTNDDENYQILQPSVQAGNGYKPDAMKFWTKKLRAIRKQDIKREQRDEL